MIKYISIFRLMLRCLLVGRKENLTGFSTGLTGRSKNLDPTGNPTGRSTRPVPVDPTSFHLWPGAPRSDPKTFFWSLPVFGRKILLKSQSARGPAPETPCNVNLARAMKWFVGVTSTSHIRSNLHLVHFSITIHLHLASFYATKYV